jgi:hypothetical protein
MMKCSHKGAGLSNIGILLLMPAFVCFYSCRKITPVADPEVNSVQLVIKDDNLIPQVNLREYILITADPKKERNTAVSVINTKKTWAAALVSRDASALTAILSGRFTYRHDSIFHNRRGYIDMMRNQTDTLLALTCQDITIQVFDSLAVVSNIVIFEFKGFVRDSLYMPDNWKRRLQSVEVYRKEQNQWKSRSVFITSRTDDVPLIIREEVPPDTLETVMDSIR